jgi:hypothetical protein
VQRLADAGMGRVRTAWFSVRSERSRGGAAVTPTHAAPAWAGFATAVAAATAWVLLIEIVR